MKDDDELPPASCGHPGCTRSRDAGDVIASAAHGPSPDGDRCTQHLPRTTANLDREEFAFKSHEGTRFNCDPRLLHLIDDGLLGVYARLVMEGPMTLDQLASEVPARYAYGLMVAVLTLMEKGLARRAEQSDGEPLFSAVTRSAQIADRLDAIGSGSYWETDEPANPRSDDPTADPGPCRNWAVWRGSRPHGGGPLLAHRRFDEPVTGAQALEALGMPLVPYTLAQLSDENWTRLVRDIDSGAPTDLLTWLYGHRDETETRV